MYFINLHLTFHSTLSPFTSFSCIKYCFFVIDSPLKICCFSISQFVNLFPLQVSQIRLYFLYIFFYLLLFLKQHFLLYYFTLFNGIFFSIFIFFFILILFLLNLICFFLLLITKIKFSFYNFITLLYPAKIIFCIYFLF